MHHTLFKYGEVAVAVLRGAPASSPSAGVGMCSQPFRLSLVMTIMSWHRMRPYIEGVPYIRLGSEMFEWYEG